MGTHRRATVSPLPSFVQYESLKSHSCPAHWTTPGVCTALVEVCAGLEPGAPDRGATTAGVASGPVRWPLQDATAETTSARTVGTKQRERMAGLPVKWVVEPIKRRDGINASIGRGAANAVLGDNTLRIRVERGEGHPLVARVRTPGAPGAPAGPCTDVVGCGEMKPPTTDPKPREADEDVPLDRELLFAVLAVQLGQATPRQVMAAASSFVLDRSRSIGDLLVASGAIVQERREMLDGMTSEALRANGGDAKKTLDSMGGALAVYASFGGSLMVDDSGKAKLAPAAPGRSDSVDEGSTVYPETPGRYQVEADAEIGRGGIGRVLVAFDTGLGRQVAIKELLTDISTGAISTPDTENRSRTGALAARFLREARVTGQLEHPNIVPVYEVGRRDNGTYYYTMKLVRGRTLATALRSCAGLRERLELLHHYVDLCQAIAYAHDRGVVHRDIKPDNVMLGEFGETVVLDWGLAKISGRKDIRAKEIRRDMTILHDAAAGKTVDGAAIGTPAYMSPEQAEGNIDDIDEKSDVWSLGAVLYELLTGKPPFEGYTPYEIIGKVMKDEVVAPRAKLDQVPAELSAVAMKALQRDKARRYEKAERLAAEINAYMSGGRIAAYEYGSMELLRMFVRKHRAASVLVVLLAVLMGVSGVGLYSAYQVANRERSTALGARDRAEEQRVIAQRESRRALANFALALAEKSAASAADKDFLKARLFAAKALETSPYNPRSPNRFDDPRKLAGADAVASRAAIQSSLYDALTHTHFRYRSKLAGHADVVHDLAFSPDDTRLASAGDDGLLVQRLGETSPMIQRGHEGAVTSVAWAPNGKSIATGGSDGTVRIWNATEGKPTGTVARHDAPLVGVVYMKHGRMIASVDAKGSLTTTPVDGNGGQEHVDLRTEVTGGLALSPNEETLVVGGRKALLLLRARGLAREGALDFAGHAAYRVGFSHDGTLVGASGSSSMARVWRIADHSIVATIKGENIDQLDFALSTDDKRALIVDDGSLNVWRLGTGRKDAHLDTPRSFVRAMAMTSDGALVALAEESGAIKLWRYSPDAEAEALTGHRTPMSWIEPAMAGKRMVSGDWYGSVRVWDTTTGEQVHELQAKGAAIWRLSVSPDGTRVSIGDFAGEIQVWDLRKQERVAAWKGSNEQIRGVVWSADMRWLASVGMEKALKVWDASTGELVRTLALSAGSWWLEWARDGRRIVLGGFDGKLRVIDTTSWKLVHELNGHEAIISGLAIAADSHTAVSTSKDGTARVWDIVEGRCLRVFRHHTAWVNRVAISPDGVWALTSSDDATARLWTVADGRESLVLRRPTFVCAVSFTPDGKRMVVNNDADLEILPFWPDLWSSDPQKVLRDAESESGVRLEGLTLVPLDESN